MYVMFIAFAWEKIIKAFYFTMCHYNVEMLDSEYTGVHDLSHGSLLHVITRSGEIES